MIQIILALTLFIIFILGLITLYLSVKPYKVALKIQLNSDEFLPQSKFQYVKPFNIHYVQIGSGPDLVLVHGLGASIYVWRFIIKPLSQYFRVTALDLPGFGQSDILVTEDYNLETQTQRLNLFLEKLKINPCYLVGSSMGGNISLWLAKLYPKKINKLILLSPAASPKTLPVPRFMIKASLPLWPTLFPTLKKGISKKILGKKVTARPYTLNNSFLTYEKDKTAFKTLVASIDVIKDPRLPKELKDLPTPTLILWGHNDHIIKEKFILQLHKILKNSSLIQHSTAHHHPMEDEPEWVTKNIVHFFDAGNK